VAKKNKKKRTQADRADRHALYQESVQDSEFELDFVQDTYKNIRGSKARLLREDFCGTARSACVWTKRHKDNRSWAVDFEHNFKSLKSSQQERVTLIQSDVLVVETPPVDIVLAFNFSYWIFQERARLLEYFKSVHASLKDDGMLMLDSFGGPEAHTIQEEEHELDDFTWTWDQAKYNSLTQEIQCYIHFEFEDGSRIDKAFSYTWRLWGGRELEDLLYEAGFSNVRFFIDESEEDEDDDDDEEVIAVDQYEETREVFDHDCWLAYIIAEK